MNADDPKGTNDILQIDRTGGLLPPHSVAGEPVPVRLAQHALHPRHRPVDLQGCDLHRTVRRVPGRDRGRIRFRSASASVLRQRKSTGPAWVLCHSQCTPVSQQPGPIWARASRCANTTRRGSRPRVCRMWGFECAAATTTARRLWPPAPVFSTRWAAMWAAMPASSFNRRERAQRHESSRLRLPRHRSE
jgi:hypothetical protein